MDEYLASAARLRGGYVFRGDLIDLGLTDDHIAQAVRAGVLERLRHGTYAPRSSDPLSSEQRHLLIARSVADKLGPSVALSHHTAALAHVGTVWGLDLTTVHVTRLDGRGSRVEAGVAFHVGRTVPDRDVCDVSGQQCVVADRAVVESNSLASVEAGMVTTSFALRENATTSAALTERMAACERWPGMLHVRLSVAKAEPGCESVGEVRSMYFFGAHRVPRPTVQYRVTAGDGREVARCDFGWDDHRHVGEFDGAVKYGRLNPHAGSDAAQVLIDEKRREDRVRAQGWGMTRWMWSELTNDPSRLARRLLDDLEQSRRLYRRPATVIN